VTYASAVHVDLATRLHQLPRTLRLESQRVEVLAEIVRSAHETLEPARVAAWLAGQLHAWLPLASWSVLEDDLMGPPRLLATHGPLAAPGDAAMLEPVVTSLASRVIRLGEEVVTASVQDHQVSAPPVAAIAVPLVARRAVIGAAVGLAAERAATEPYYSDAARRLLGLVLEPGACALDNARRFVQAQALSVTDDLTRVYNARFLGQVLSREIKRAVRTGQPLSVLFIDIDGFKVVNDSFGHLSGSRTLVELATLFRACARETDVLARYGGDEFAMILPETPEAGGWAVAERIRDRVAKHHFLTSEGRDVRLTVSIGLATRTDERLSAVDLLHAADRAMYWVKAHGKNGTHVARHAGDHMD